MTSHTRARDTQQTQSTQCTQHGADFRVEQGATLDQSVFLVFLDEYVCVYGVRVCGVVQPGSR